MIKIFVDTNIFLHFKYFIEIDWLEICQDEKCKVVISPVVIDELDKYKVRNDEKGKRAKKVLQRVEECEETKTYEIRKNVELEVIQERPKKNTFKSYHLNPDEQDHQLIACIIEYKIKHKDNGISLCSYDIGPRLRSKQFGIKVIKMPDIYLLPEKDNALEKQIKTLLKENALLKSRIPQPVLIFKNEKEFIKIKIQDNKTDQLTYVRDKLSKLKIEFPYMKFNSTDEKYFNPIAPISILNTISDDQVKKYNSSLDDFYSEYGAYLYSLYEYESKIDLSFKIDLYITNKGNVPAEDVDIYCHFPDGFELIEVDDLEDPPKKPNPPSTPKTVFENFGDITSSINLRPLLHDFNSPPIPKLNRPSIKKTNSYDVRFSRKSIKHCTVYPLDGLVGIYERFSDIKNFAMDYNIIAGNVPEPISGSLNFIFVQ